MLRRLTIAAVALALAPLAAAAQQPSDRTPPPLRAFGPTQNEAQQNAMEDARVWVQHFLDDRFPNLGWSPSAEYLVRIGTIRVDPPKRVDPTDKEEELKNLGPGYEAVAHIDVTDAKLSVMQEQVDEARRRALEPTVSQRHFLVGRVLAGLVAVLLVAAGYLRLEELTRGYYTTLLRLGAGAVLALAVVGLFLVA